MPAMSTPLVIATSPHDVASTVDRVRTALRTRGVTLFAAIDHAAGAREAGLQLADEVLLVFGNPATGTGLMQADPRVGLDLPLRLLVWDEQGTTQIAFSDPAQLATSYSLDGHLPVLSQLRALLDQLVAEATQ
jgi:uncharacterized protein (DUF302 family)